MLDLVSIMTGLTEPFLTKKLSAAVELSDRMQLAGIDAVILYSYDSWCRQLQFVLKTKDGEPLPKCREIRSNGHTWIESINLLHGEFMVCDRKDMHSRVIRRCHPF